ncbi:MAG: hypothetical protein DRI57_09855 [Deltaproteobacteria bacterium]|nr:MAG: hypothetical protein DRI57_09855 [Deltaproteobacteria bacterium]
MRRVSKAEAQAVQTTLDSLYDYLGGGVATDYLMDTRKVLCKTLRADRQILFRWWATARIHAHHRQSYRTYITAYPEDLEGCRTLHATMRRWQQRTSQPLRRVRLPRVLHSFLEEIKKVE